MPNREEALRRIFEATGVSARLTDDQKRELLAHVEDAVEAKVGAGVPEMEAVGQAFSELGDLEKIAGQFPGPQPVAVTPEGPLSLETGRALTWSAFCFFALFLALSWYVTPKFAAVFQQVRVPLPGLTALFLTISQGFRPLPVLLGVVVLLSVLEKFGLRRIRIPRPIGYVLLVASVTLCVGLVVSLFLPLVSLLEGIGRR